jgi:putative SOS response-associated peptidase YedK
MVTTQANAAMCEIHHRMPVFLAQNDWGLWLGDQAHGAAALMRPAEETVMQ